MLWNYNKAEERINLNLLAMCELVGFLSVHSTESENLGCDARLNWKFCCFRRHTLSGHMWYMPTFCDTAGDQAHIL